MSWWSSGYDSHLDIKRLRHSLWHLEVNVNSRQEVCSKRMRTCFLLRRNECIGGLVVKTLIPITRDQGSVLHWGTNVLTDYNIRGQQCLFFNVSGSLPDFLAWLHVTGFWMAFFRTWQNKRWRYQKQESIPVWCLLLTCWPEGFLHDPHFMVPPLQNSLHGTPFMAQPKGGTPKSCTPYINRMYHRQVWKHYLAQTSFAGGNDYVNNES